MTTSTAQGEHAQTEAQPIQRFEVVDCIDSKHVPAVIPNASGPWVRYEDHAAQVAALTAAPNAKASIHALSQINAAQRELLDAMGAHTAQPAEGAAKVNWWEVDGDKYDDSITRAPPAPTAQAAPATQQAGEVRPVTPYTCPKCHALWLHWPAEQTGFGRDTLNCRSADHCHYCEKAGVEQLQRLERIPAALHAPQPTPAAQADSVSTFQQRVQPWLLECFGAEIAADRVERNHRFFEESTELVQANGMTSSEAHQLVDYVFGRPVGDPPQEVGGVMVTLAALCLASGLDMHDAGEVELARINVPELVAKIRAKQAAKPKHSPLPEATTAQAAPAAGAVAGSTEPTQEMIAAVLRLVDLGQSDPEDHRYDDGSKLATQICRAMLAAAPDSVLEDAARWRAWAAGMVEACAAPHGVIPPFMAAFEEAVGDSDASFSVEQLNGWVDAARKQGGAT